MHELGAIMKKNADLDTLCGRYYLARKQGNTKEAAQRIAGYADVKHSTRIEASKSYVVLEKKYAKTLKDKISLDQLAEEHIKNIRQDKDKGAKNIAIKMALDKIEPAEGQEVDVGDVSITLKPR